MILELKSQFVAKFEMKDLGITKNIPKMEIIRYTMDQKLWLGQSKYVSLILLRFNMQYYRPPCIPFIVRMNLFTLDYPTSPSKMEDMTGASYHNVDGSFMYGMICSRLDIAQEVGVLSRYMYTFSVFSLE